MSLVRRCWLAVVLLALVLVTHGKPLDQPPSQTTPGLSTGSTETSAVGSEDSAVPSHVHFDGTEINTDQLFELADTDHDSMLNKPEFVAAVEELFKHDELRITVKDPHNWLESIANVGSGGGFWAAFANSLVMIWATELGDKTFFIAAILAMRHSPTVVFTGAISALAVMTVLSAAMGFALPNIMPRAYTHYASAALFLYFGVKLLVDAYSMDDSVSDEYAEAEEELEAHVPYDPVAVEDSESATELDTLKDEEVSSPVSVIEQPSILTKAFTLTFLAEWGDRSQIATVALAADKNPFGVTLGGVVGHSCCTGLAVLSGSYLAEKVSERTTTIVGGVLFLAFAVHAVLTPPEA